MKEEPGSDRENDGRKLVVLLRHWMEHNRGHAHEFRHWAESTKRLGCSEASERIKRAAEQIERANEFLGSALSELEDF